MEQTFGYALLSTDNHYLDKYEDWISAGKNSAHLDMLRSVLAHHESRDYRGIDREFLTALAPPPDGQGDDDWYQEFGAKPSDPTYRARVRLGEMTVTYPDTLDFDEDILPDIESACEVAALICAPAEFETVRLDRVQRVNTDSTLGFDVGYWGGDHYSIIADSAVKPTWHPPQPQDFDVLREALQDLNGHCLFPTADSASRFRELHSKFAWAETGGTPFHIIRIETV